MNKIQSPTPDITNEACAWIAQLETGKLLPEDVNAFKEWIQRSPAHAIEIKRLAQLSMDINVIANMKDSLVQASADKTKTADHQRPNRNLFYGVATACTLLFAVLSMFFLVNNQSERIEQPLLLSTLTGEYKEIELSDGSKVTLNTQSQLEVDFSESVRKVRLLSGEAYFDVAHNPQRPFLVYANEQYVRAVGTAFVVSLLRENFSVTVVEGLVELAQLEDLKEPEKPLKLKVGEKVAISPVTTELHIETIAERDMQRELSWQIGLLDFSDTPLLKVVEEVSRYSHLKIEIADQALADMKFGGIFRTNDIAPLFQALESSYNVNVVYVSDDHIQLSINP